MAFAQGSQGDPLTTGETGAPLNDATAQATTTTAGNSAVGAAVLVSVNRRELMLGGQTHKPQAVIVTEGMKNV